MERDDAIQKLKQLENVDLVNLAHKYNITIWKSGKKHKGWAGHVLERYLELPINSAQSPDFGSWELKIVPLKQLVNGIITVKETMAITMIDPCNVKKMPFENSHLLAKLKKAIICARKFESKAETHSLLVRVAAFDLDDPVVYEQVRRDYEETRICIIERGFESLTGKMGTLIQPRTKGPGHGSISRAFYARTPFVAQILGLK